MKLSRPVAIKNIRTNFCHELVNDYNTLPAHAVSASNAAQFEVHLDTRWFLVPRILSKISVS